MSPMLSFSWKCLSFFRPGRKWVPRRSTVQTDSRTFITCDEAGGSIFMRMQF